MEIIFIISIFTFIILLFIKRYRTLSLTCLLGLLLLLLLFFPDNSLNAAKDGINLWLFIVVPSLLPFFIINDMLSSLRVPENISILFSPIAKNIFKTSGYGAYAFIMSVFAGYPSGARIVSTLLEEKKVTKYEAEKILTFSSTSGPLFIIGAVGSGMLQNTVAGYILFISHILGSILNGIFSRLLFKKEPISLCSNKLGLKKLDEDIILKGIKNSLITCGYIGGYIILFCVIVELLNTINLFDFIASTLNSIGVLSPTFITNLTLLFESIVEISNGCNIISLSLIPFNTKLILLSFVIAFSGFAVIGQVSGILSKFKLNMKKYIFFKFTHGIFSSIICYIMLTLNLFSLPTVSLQHLSNISILNNSVIILLIIILVCNTLGFIIRKSKENS
ncbi:MAG: hypothetical protein RR515_05090 [Clostridium sp.]